ncbi:hypothetical protein Aple_010930 [Acrocarpospora pleiomorpha]|uniref:Uncharacterized protein n=1 Tax=Acrocarpospora pleiomorpha TaxID=90975 RepID=A0A5M3XJF0_9ACTN|nr:hypothetical protein [Acrocarpospora pleiomorpha]GES18198.1 hypothetical protein Aple_010930 [Acrocarpospora pleiomorpha]
MPDLTLPTIPAAVWLPGLAVVLLLVLAVVLLARAVAAARRVARMAQSRAAELAAADLARARAAMSAAADVAAEEAGDAIATLHAALAARTAPAATTDVSGVPRAGVRRRLRVDPQRRRVPVIYRQAAATFRPLLDRGELPTFRAVMKALGCGQGTANTVRAYLAAKLAGDETTARRVIVEISTAVRAA